MGIRDETERDFRHAVVNTLMEVIPRAARPFYYLSFKHVHTDTRVQRSSFVSPMYASPGMLVFTDPAAHVPAQAGQELLGSAERSRIQRGLDVCRSSQVSTCTEGM